MPSQQAEWDQLYSIRRNKHPRLVTEGDSWFAYPMWRNMDDFVSASNRYALCRRGESGRRLKQIVDQHLYLDAVQHEQPILVLISGGGNDFVNREFVTGADGKGTLFEVYQDGTHAEDLINVAKWSDKLHEIADLFERIIGRLNGIPVVTHGYDYIIPNGAGAMYDGIKVAGPWIQPTMIKPCNITNAALQTEIAVLMIDSLNETLASLQAAHPGVFVHADLRGTLDAHDWANEIHPYEDGFRRLANRYLEYVNAAYDRATGGGPTPIV